MDNCESIKDQAVQKATTIEEREVLAQEGLAGISIQSQNILAERKVAAVLRKIKQCAANQIRNLKAIKLATKDALSKVIDLLTGKSFEATEGLPLVCEVSRYMANFQYATG